MRRSAAGFGPPRCYSGPADPNVACPNGDVGFWPKAAITAYAVTLSCVRCSRDAVSEPDWAGDGAERFKAFTSAKDRHVAIVKQSPED